MKKLSFDRKAKWPLSICLIAHDRVADECQMNADLVGSPRLDDDIEERRFIEALEHVEMG